MKFKLVLVNGYFGQRLPTSCSMDTSEIIQHFNSLGHTCEKIDIHELANKSVDKDFIYLVSSHQNSGIKKYLNDVVTLKFLGNEKNVIPSVKNFIAHENKGVQAMITADWEDLFVKQGYYYDKVVTNFPKVVKRPSGSGSVGVSLVRDEEGLQHSLKKMFFLDYSLSELLFIIKEISKKIFFRKKLSLQHTVYFKKYNPYVLQDYIPELKGDYKILVFGKKVYVLTRQVRKNDFRASGSGLFSFEEADHALLDFALLAKKMINTPMVSLDVVAVNGSYKCIEYQCTHFGPYTQFEAKHYYEYTENNTWEKKGNNITLEQLFAEAVNDYLKNYD